MRHLVHGGAIALELADSLFVLVAIANEQKIDLEEAFQRALHRYDTRDRDRWTRQQDR